MTLLVREELAAAVRRAAQQLIERGALPPVPLPEVKLDVPPSPELGDYSSNLPFELSRAARKAAPELAHEIAGALELPDGLVGRVEVAGAGFLNFRLRPGWLEETVRRAAEEGETYGRDAGLGQGRPVLVEFVSANPTGPLTVTHGRGAALGEAVANLLEWSGYRVSREFYVNDAGTQMERFGRSLEARYLRALGVRGLPLPADGYSTPHVAEVTAAILAEAGERYRDLPAEQRLEAITEHGREETVHRQRETLARFGVQFDEWYSEQEMYAGGKLETVLEVLRRSGHAYEADGALWLRTSDLGDSEDYPLLRSNGRPAYLAGDLAYHLDKFHRGFERLIDVWGPDHSIYVRRTRAGVRALGRDPEAVDIVIFGPVSLKVNETLVEDGGPAGNNFALDEVIDQVGAATARFLYLARPAGVALDLDLDLAREHGSATSAGTVRAAYARLAELAGEKAVSPAEAELTRLTGAPERELMRLVARFPDEVRSAARSLEPHGIVRYLLDLSRASEGLRIEGDAAEQRARRALAGVAHTVFGNALAVLGI
ncbi:MAG TPA: arginine--tRNA ligase, partial [Armatimonadota bacterium]|nr:arginine--tRNA ligase [Armatimonadota bacterium]